MHNFSFRKIITIAFCFCILTTTTICMEQIGQAVKQAVEQDVEEFKKDMQTLKEDIEIVADLIAPSLSTLIGGELSAITHNKYKNTIATVWHKKGICSGERKFLEKRFPIVKAALETMLNQTLKNHIPKIAFIPSGGGFRAAFCTAAALYALEEIGVLEAITYITALSGSTWAVAPWISSGMSPKKFKNYLQKVVSKPFHELTHNEMLLIARAAAVKETYNQPRTLADPYGDLLGNTLFACFGDARHTTYLSNQRKKIKNGKYPYPIYTAIDGRDGIDNPIWYEFTPYAIGDHANNTRVAAWGYGREFENGKSTNNAPEKPLGHILATCGSAFAADLKEILENITPENAQKEDHIKITGPLAEKRILPFYAEIPNYMYKMDNLTDPTLSNHQHMRFVDAGLDANLPYQPISGICPERTADILIFLDASAGHIGGELKKAADYAHKNNLLFPPINLDEIHTKTITVFKDAHNKKCPVVIYMPRISDKKLWEEHRSKPEFKKHKLSDFDLDHETNHGFAATQCFQYKPEHSQLIMDQIEFNILVNKEVIKDAIKWKIDRT